MKFEVISTLDDYERKTEIQMTKLWIWNSFKFSIDILCK